METQKVDIDIHGYDRCHRNEKSCKQNFYENKQATYFQYQNLDLIIKLLIKMEEDEYDDELPPISVNCSSKEVSVFSMPSAEVLASQRAREEECERELREMRERHEKQTAAFAAVKNGAPTLPSRSDSSSSEGEAALTSAVEELRVENSPGNGVQRPPATELLDSMLAQLPTSASQLCREYRDALMRGSAREIDSLTDDLITDIASWLCGFDSETVKLDSSGEEMADTIAENSPSDDEVLGVGAWLSAAVSWRAPAAPRARARHALLALLNAATHDQVRSLCAVLVVAVRAPRGRLSALSALSASGRAPRAAALRDALTRCALHDLLQSTEEANDADAFSLGPLSLQELAELTRRGWRGVPDSQRELTLLLLGRALHAAKYYFKEEDGTSSGLEVAQAPPVGLEELQASHSVLEGSQTQPSGLEWSQAPVSGHNGLQANGRAGSQRAATGPAGSQVALQAALSALSQPLSATPQGRHQPDHLKIAVAASKLQILLSDRN